MRIFFIFSSKGLKSAPGSSILYYSPYVTERNAKEVIESLDLESNDLMELFSNNKMKANPLKFHLSTSSNDKLKIWINNDAFNSTTCKKPLEVMIDSKFNFHTHVNDTCKEKKKKRTKNFCIIQNNSFHGVAEEVALNEYIFHVSIQLLPCSLDVPPKNQEQYD